MIATALKQEVLFMKNRFSRSIIALLLIAAMVVPSIALAATTDYMYATTPLNVRSGAGTGFPVVGHLQINERVTVIGASGNWYMITYAGGTGYASKKYLSPTMVRVPTGNTPVLPVIPADPSANAYVNTASLNVRSGAGTKYSKIGVLYQNEKVTVLSTSNGWSKIQSGRWTGYVYAKYLTAIGGTPSTPITPPAASSEMYVNTTSLNVRSGASTKYSKIGLLYKGEKVTVISTSGKWSKIQYGAWTGYVYSSYLSKAYVAPNTGFTPGTGTGTGSSVIPTGTYFVGNDQLGVYSGPAMFYSVIGSLPRSTKVTVYACEAG